MAVNGNEFFNYAGFNSVLYFQLRGIIVYYNTYATELILHITTNVSYQELLEAVLVSLFFTIALT